MTGWPLVALADCCHIVSGATPKTSVATYWDGDIDWVTPKDLSHLDGAYIHETPRRITKAGLTSCGATVLPPQSVLFSSRAPIGHVAINTVPMATNQGFKSLIPHANRVDAKYLFHWLRTNRSYLEGLGNGATFKEVSKAIVSRIEIPLPPLDQQRRIAAILDQADALRAKRREALEHLHDLTQSIFLEMFGEPGSNPHNWKRARLGDLASKFSDGPFGSNLKSSHYVEAGVRVVRLQNIGVGEFIDNDQAYVSESHFASLRKHQCQPGDVLVATLGDPNLRACIQPDWLPIALNKADCVQVRVDPDIATPEFVRGLINQPGTLTLAHSLMLGQTRVRISMGRLRELQVPVPPVERQREFAKIIRSVEHEKTLQLEHQDHLVSAFTSLQWQAFAGEL